MLRPFFVTENPFSSLVSFSFTVSFRDKSKQVMLCFFQSLFLFAIDFSRSPSSSFPLDCFVGMSYIFCRYFGSVGDECLLKDLRERFTGF